MLVTRIELEAPVTSFRYPHFLVGLQPTYEMPPPATLYGHLCSAAGEWVPAEAVRIGLRFTYAAKADDLEHQTLISSASGRLPGTQFPKVVEGSVTPVRREFLFDARLTLYVSGDWVDAFRSPRHAVVLGRSQDLASYRSIALVDLERDKEAYYEHTLLPWRLRPAVLRARAETMARWIDYENGRRVWFDRFLIVKDRVMTSSPDHWIRLAGGDDEHWVDPTAQVVSGLRRAVWMHSLREGEV